MTHTNLFKELLNNKAFTRFGIMIIAVLFSTGLFVQVNCSSGKTDLEKALASWEKGNPPGKLSVQYPKDNTIFPPDMAPPTFSWKDETLNVNAWRVVIAFNGKEVVSTLPLNETKWKPTKQQWQTMKNPVSATDTGTSASPKTSDVNLVIGVIGINTGTPDQILSGSRFDFHISADEVGASIFYRDVPLPFEFAYKNLHTIRWRLADISSEAQAPVVLSNLPLCGNCHSFTRDGTTLAMDVDYANDKGSYVISKIEKQTVMTPDKIITWSDYRKEDGEMTFGLLSQISPDGRYAVSTVKDRSIFVPKNDLYYSQLFFPIKGILAIYDLKAKTFSSLPGADDPQYVQSSPTWTPDGRDIIFARAPVYHSEEAEKFKQAVLPPSVALEFTEGRRGFQYDLYRIPFNEGKGGTPVPVPGGGANGKSNYFPRVSPDGKWLVFCQADNFMLLQPDSKLYIMPTEGGTPRLMNCNSINMNSWHSWSPNSRWLVYASKSGGPYTQLYLTHIDENGMDSPSVLLESLVIPKRAANIPEFVNLKDQDTVLEKIVDRFTDSGNYFIRIGGEKMYAGKYEEAVEAYNKAIEVTPKFPLLYLKRGEAMYKLDRMEDAVKDYNQALELNPSMHAAFKNRGNVKFRMRKFREAIEDYGRALKLKPDFVEALARRAAAKYQLNDAKGAFSDINKAIRINPEDFILYNDRGAFYLRQGQFKKAREDFNKAIRFKPEDDALYVSRGDVRFKLRDLNGAIADYDRALELNPKQTVVYFKRGMVKVMSGQDSEGLTDLKEADRLGFKGAREQIQIISQRLQSQ